jgi:hypothetical protein
MHVPARDYQKHHGRDGTVDNPFTPLRFCHFRRSLKPPPTLNSKQGTSHLHAVLRVAWVNSSFELRVPQMLSGSHRLDQSAKKKKAKIGRRPEGIP